MLQQRSNKDLKLFSLPVFIALSLIVVTEFHNLICHPKVHYVGRCRNFNCGSTFDDILDIGPVDFWHCCNSCNEFPRGCCMLFNVVSLHFIPILLSLPALPVWLTPLFTLMPFLVGAIKEELGKAIPPPVPMTPTQPPIVPSLSHKLPFNGVKIKHCDVHLVNGSLGLNHCCLIEGKSSLRKNALHGMVEGGSKVECGMQGTAWWWWP